MLVVFYLFIYGWQRQSAVDFSYGFFKCLLPFLYIYIYHFYRKQNFSTKLTALYRAEAIKFILTMVLSLLPSNGYSLSILLRFLLVFYWH